MPRPLLFNTPQNQNIQQPENRLSATMKSEDHTETRSNGPSTQRALRKRRSQKYMDIMSKLDAGSGNISPRDIEDMIQAIREEFPDIEIFNEYCGCMAICHLPGNFDVHILSPGSNCITHFGAGFGFETPLDSCRNLCRMPEYRFVEVYTNSLKAISANGAVANIDARGAGEAWRRLERQPATPMSGPSEGFL